VLALKPPLVWGLLQLPFALNVATALTGAAMQESRKLMSAGSARFASAQTLMDDIEENPTSKSAALPLATDYLNSFLKGQSGYAF
jgi:hypothetical protein